MSESQKGRVISKETREKLSKTLKGKKRGSFSEEHKEKMRQAWIKRKENGLNNTNI